MVERPIGANLRAALEDKGWSYTRLIAEMRRIAARERVTLPTTRSLVVMLSRWCNDQERPSEFYQSLLSKALGCSPAVLGFVDLPELNRSSAAPSRFVADGIAAWGQLLGVAGVNSTALSTAELLSGASWRSPHRDPGAESTVVSGKVGAELLDTPDAMTEGYRRLDRQLGAASVFDDSTHHLQRITRLKDASMATEHRRRLASAAGEVASLAAWQALDLGRPGTAWSYYCLATRAAREAGHRELHAYVVAETSYVLLFGGQVREALSLVKRARHLARGTTPRLRAWLAAAHAEASAIAGNAGILSVPLIRPMRRSRGWSRAVVHAGSPTSIRPTWFGGRVTAWYLWGSPIPPWRFLKRRSTRLMRRSCGRELEHWSTWPRCTSGRGRSTRPATHSLRRSGWPARRSPPRTSDASSMCADACGPGTQRAPSANWTSYLTG
jgi:transcriptional regulator with XRE-family HTH domain